MQSNSYGRKVNVKLLTYLLQKDAQRLTEGRKMKIWVHHEFDSHQTNFEMLSNKHVIGIETTLKGTDLNILMTIFQELFDHNCWRVEYWVDITEASPLDVSDKEMYQQYKDFFKSEYGGGSGENVKLSKKKSKKVAMVYQMKRLLTLF